jgi:DNA-binding SARP family transcriptional activator/WD40 repeat protein
MLGSDRARLSSLKDVFLRVLGTLVVEAGTPSVPLPVPGAKERALLGRLLVSPGRVVAVDTLVEDVWQGVPPPTARKSLQAHVVRLRTALEPERPKGSPGQYVVRRGDGYALAVAPECVDTTLATIEAAAGRAALAGGDVFRARNHFGTALALWRGEPFADWDGAGWAQAERRRLADVQTALLEARVDADLALGQHREVVAELEALVGGDPLHEGWWTRLMLALYRSDRQADALAAGRRARAALAEELGVDPGPGLRRMEQAILEQAEELDIGGPSPQLDISAPGRSSRQECPYRGLAVYEAADADLFYGRGAALRALVARTSRALLVVVSGPSGAGKSSLVRAGLLPALAGGALPDSRSWRAVVITPGQQPVDRLSPLLADHAPADEGAEAASPVVLVVDQFEELWTGGTAEAERSAFLHALLELLDDKVTARVVLVVRGDHLGRLTENADLAERVTDGLLLVPPLTDAELREVVEGPAAVAGLTVDPDLTAAVVRDVGGQAAALPLLSSALVGTWERRRDATLTLAGYLEAGGVTGALARTADTVLAGLEAGQALARRMLIRLAASGETGVPVRRRVPLSELGFTGPDGQARQAVVEAFVARRLLTIDAQHLEVTHEALLTSWPRLAGWLAEDAAGRAVRTHLAPEARDWAAAGRPEDRLYRGARLDAALEWLTRPDADPTPTEWAFIAASTTRSEAELAEARAQTRRERAGRRRTRQLAAVLAAATVAALTAGLLAAQRQGQANVNAQRADANRLAAASASAPALDTSLLLAAEAYRTEHTPQTEDALLAADVDHRKVTAVFRAGEDAVHRIAVSPDGRTLYGTGDGEVVAWDLASHRKEILARYDSPNQIPTDVEVSPTLSGANGGLVAIVKPPVPGRASTLSLLQPDGSTRWTRDDKDLGGWPMTTAFTRDGGRLGVVVIAGYGGSHPVRKIVFVDVTSGASRPTGIQESFPAGGEGDIWQEGFSPNATSVVTGGVTDWVVHDLDHGTSIQLDSGGRDPASLGFLPVVGGGFEASVDGSLYWYPNGGGRAQPRFANDASLVLSAATDPSGKVLVTGGSDQTVVVSDLVHGAWQRQEVLTGHHGEVLQVAVSPDRTRAFSTSDDGTVIEWDLTDSHGFGALIPPIPIPDPLPAQVHSSLIVIGPPVVAGKNPTWVMPTFRWPQPELQGEIFATFMDPRTRRPVADVPLGTAMNAPTAGTALSPNGRRLAITSMFSTAIIDVDTRRVIHRITLPRVATATAVDRAVLMNVPEPVWATAWSPDGSRLLLGTGGAHRAGAPGAVVVVNTSTWRPERRVLDPGDVSSLDLSPNHRLLAVGLLSGEVIVVDPDGYRVIRRLPAHGPVNSVKFSPDSSRLAAVGESGRLDLWNVETGRAAFARPPSLGNSGTSVQWLPDRKTIVYGSWSGRAVLFDTARRTVRGVPIPVFRDAGHGSFYIVPTKADRLELVPGYRYVGQTREGVVYSLNPADWLAQACAVAGRDLTQAEWAAYVPERPYRRTCGELN